MPFCDVLRSVLCVLRVLLSAVLLFCPFCQIIEKGIKTMSKNEYAVLRNIMHDLKDGYVFGKDYTWDYYENKPYRYPFFGSALYLTPSKNIGYTHYGSSATKLTLKLPFCANISAMTKAQLKANTDSKRVLRL